MAGAGCDDETMTAVMLDPGLSISAHIRDQSNSSRYLERQIRRARVSVDNSPRPPPRGLSDEQKRILLSMQRKELRLLHRLRQLKLRFETWASEKGVDLGHLYNPVQLGFLIHFTVEEDDRFATDPMGRRDRRYRRKGRLVVSPAARFPRRLMPAGFTKRQTVERRKKFNRPKRTAAERSRRDRKRAAKTVMVQQAADLNCRKSTILAVLSDEWMTISDLTKNIANSRAFMSPDGKTFLKGDTLRRAVSRELAKDDLKSRIEISEEVHKNGFPMKRIRRRPPGSG
jgi:hypothetical protein